MLNHMATMQRFTRSGAFHLLLLLLTALSVFCVFLFVWGGGVEGDFADRAWASALFAACMLLILGAHEMGHYLMARQHGVEATWPYFIPFPLGFGTLGAVIRLKSRVPTRNALVDIGAAGPLAGLLIAIPVLAVGIWFSEPVSIPQSGSPAFPSPTSLWHLAQMVGQAAHAWVWGGPGPEAYPTVEVFGDNLLSLGLVRLIHGPLLPGHDLVAHPTLLAGWFGMLVTMLNLLPVGQLDGGHLTFAWLGDRAIRVGHLVASGLLVLALFFSISWLVWYFLVSRIVGFGHPPVENPNVRLTAGRKVVIVICWVMTILTFMPLPMGLA